MHEVSAISGEQVNFTADNFRINLVTLEMRQTWFVTEVNVKYNVFRVPGKLRNKMPITMHNCQKRIYRRYESDLES